MPLTKSDYTCVCIYRKSISDITHALKNHVKQSGSHVKSAFKAFSESTFSKGTLGTLPEGATQCPFSKELWKTLRQELAKDFKEGGAVSLVTVTIGRVTSNRVLG